jgi:hypothetical protein
MLQIRPNARTTPVPRSPARLNPPPSLPGATASALRPSAKGVRWRLGLPRPLRSATPAAWEGQRGRTDRCLRPAPSHFTLDNLSVVVCHFLPHLNRDSIWRILKAEGLNCRPKPVAKRSARASSRITTSDSSVSTSSTCPSCRPPMSSRDSPDEGNQQPESLCGKTANRVRRAGRKTSRSLSPRQTANAFPQGSRPMRPRRTFGEIQQNLLRNPVHLWHQWPIMLQLRAGTQLI